MFLAALTGISPNLYEAAAIDGASRWQSIRNITLPAWIPTVVLLTTLAMGNVLNAGFDQVFNMYSPMAVIIMMAYPLSKSSRRYKPRTVMMWILIFCMLFNGGTIPWFITMKNYGLVDTMAGLALCGSVPVFNVILLMNFFRNLPSDLEEAAAIDGAGTWRIL